MQTLSTAAVASNRVPFTRARATHSNKRIWTGRILSALPVLFLVFDTVIKLLNIEPVRVAFTRLGYPVEIAFAIGLLELVCVAVHLVPRTAVIGAVLLTGFLGGAIATHVRLGDPLFTHILFPVYIGALIWGGLCLRDPRARTMFLPKMRKHNS